VSTHRPFAPLDTLCVNTLRTLAIDCVQKANSGHPGLPLGAAPMAYVLWDRHLKHDPANPRWPDRDRFVLSAGHGCMLLYSLLHLTGYDLTLDDLKAFRQWGSRTPGHPEVHLTPGVEATTGPLGQGHANAVGMAIAERMLAHRFNRPGHEIVNHRTWALVSDGDLMEGLTGEAASLAGHLRLGKLVCLYDSNDVSLDGPTAMAYSEDWGRRYEAYGWRVLRVEQGDDDLAAIDAAIESAKADDSRPVLIVVRTTIGFGSPNKAGKASAHGSPLGPDEVAATKQALGWDPKAQFHLPAEALARFRDALARGKAAREQWQGRFDAWAQTQAVPAQEWRRRIAGELPAGWDAELGAYKAGESAATRDAGGKALQALAAKLPELAGGDADLAESTKTAIKGGGDFDGRTGAGRNFHFGVREHAMGSIANGMAYHGGVRPYVSTFFVFSDYMRPAIRLAAINQLPVIYVFTHDSVAVGEDGPTHQPIEHLASLRAIPGLHVVRPGDPNETLEAWRYAIQRRDGPTVLVFTRQKLAVLDRSALAPGASLSRGGYVLAEAAGGAPQAILIATGSEVKLALDARETLQQAGARIRVVSLPCWEAFAAQEKEYRDSVLPPAVRARVSVEAGATFGWSRWTGDAGIAVGIDRFGASAPGEVNLEKFGFTADHVAAAVRSAMDRAR